MSSTDTTTTSSSSSVSDSRSSDSPSASSTTPRPKAEGEEVEESELDILESIARDENANEEYEAALELYFSLKRKYDRNLEIARGKALKKATGGRKGPYSKRMKERIRAEYRNIIPKCIRCRKDGGTVFEETNRTYVARCGRSGKPCPLDVRIKKITAARMSEQVTTEIKETQEDLKRAIMLLRLKYLFEHITAEELAEEYEELKAGQAEVHEIYTTLLEAIDVTTKQTDRDRRIHALNKHIQAQKDALVTLRAEYNRTDEADETARDELMRRAAEIHMDNIYPFVKALREAQNDAAFVREVPIGSDAEVALAMKNQPKSAVLTRLVKRPIAIINDEIPIEPGEVLATKG
jgi:hypothetical protein